MGVYGYVLLSRALDGASPTNQAVMVNVRPHGAPRATYVARQQDLVHWLLWKETW
jgi:hypothetical protein